MLSADELAKGVPVQMFTFFQLLVLVQIFSHS